MKILINIFIALAVLFCLISCENQAQIADTFKPKTIEVHYPETRRDNQVDDYHGRDIEDPYRWLEDDHGADTKKWVEAQNAVTEAYLEQIPYRDMIRDRLERLWNYERYGAPFKKGDRYYFFKNDGLQNQNILYAQKDLYGEASIVLDPNSFSEDGTVSLGGFAFNREGNLLAYLTSEGGSDWHTIRIKDLKTGKLLSDKIEWVKFSGVSWHGQGFYYSRFPEPKEGDELSGQNSFHKVFYHRLGTIQKDDKLILDDPERPQRNFFAGTTEDEQFLFVSISESTSGNALKVKDLSSPLSRWISIEENFDSDFRLQDNIGKELYILTNHQAPNWRLIGVDIRHPEEANWREILPEREQVLIGTKLAGGHLVAEHLVDAKSQVKVYDYNGTMLRELSLPGIGSVGEIQGTKDDKVAFYSFTSYTHPTSIYSLDLQSYESDLFKQPNLDINLNDYATEQVFFKSKDGTKVPMFITMKKGLVRDGSNPTLLYGYGGFDISLTPSFSITNTILLENGGIYAVANLRGGGEYGQTWHLAGTKERKQNVFDDFQAAAEYLIEKKYTSPEKLAIMGGSNGGLLVGACMTQRPDLYKVAIPRVGVLDMLRYHQFTIGWAWAEDYGRSDDPNAFDYLVKYSPLHNVREEAYPATMIMTADHDDRVVPAHSFKFAAEMQGKQLGDNAVLIRVETSAGHGAGKPTSKLIEESVDMLSFMFFNMREDIKYPDIDS